MTGATNNALVLSGWACSVEALQREMPFETTGIDYSDYASEDLLFEALRTHKNTQHIIAWSQGAQLALKALARGVLYASKVTLIAPPVKFVQDDMLKAAMDVFTYEQFCQNYEASPARTKQRFHGLVAKSDRHQKRIMSELKQHSDAENIARWLPWLQRLNEHDLRKEVLSTIRADIQVIHGLNDQIVPAKQAHMLQTLFPDITLHLWPDCAHAPHLHDAERFASLVSSHHGVS